MSGHHGGDSKDHTVRDWIIVALLLVAILALAAWAFWLQQDGVRALQANTTNSHARAYAIEARMQRAGNVWPVNLPEPDDAVNCPMDDTKILIEVGKEIHVRIPGKTRMEPTPSVDTGLVSICSYFQSELCDPPGEEPLKINDDIVTVTNLDTEDVQFDCGYGPL